MRSASLTASLSFLICSSWLQAATKPNIIVILADDLGFADVGFQGGKDAPTPNIDSLASGGVRFTNGYVSGCVCSPSRAGLMTGRYQERTGHEANPPERRNPGLDLKEITMARHLKDAGYVTGIVGKWHLGEDKEHFPLARGFDEFFGLLPHGIGAGKNGEDVPVYRGWDKVVTPADHTETFGAEAVGFIERHHDVPFFLYLPFTAVHAPHVAPASYLKKFESIKEKRRRALCAMISVMDDQVGAVLAKLREHKLEESTLIFFLSDNGGPEADDVDNGPLRGGKWTVWEGGIHVPFVAYWKGHVTPRVLDTQVIQLDILPTALAVAGVEVKPEWKLDGVNLLPLLEGKSDKPVHEALFWRFGPQFAVRSGDMKLLKPSLNAEPRLVNLKDDLGEKTDLASDQPEKVKELTALWEKWNAGNIAPRWVDNRWNGTEERKESKKAKKNK